MVIPTSFWYFALLLIYGFLKYLYLYFFFSSRLIKYLTWYNNGLKAGYGDWIISWIYSVGSNAERTWSHRLQKYYVFWCLEKVKTEFSSGVTKNRTDVQTNPDSGADQTMGVTVSYSMGADVSHMCSKSSVMDSHWRWQDSADQIHSVSLCWGCI